MNQKILRSISYVAGAAMVLFLTSVCFIPSSLASGLKPNHRAQQELASRGIDTSRESLERLALDRSLDTEVRSLSILALAQTGEFKYVKPLTELLREPDQSIHHVVLVGLRQMKAESASADVHSFLLNKNNDPDARMTAIGTLAELSPRKSPELLIDFAGRVFETPEVRQQALIVTSYLVNLNVSDYAPLRDKLLMLSEDVNPQVRWAAAIVMSAGLDANAIDLLVSEILLIRSNATGDQLMRTLTSIEALERQTGQDFSIGRDGKSTRARNADDARSNFEDVLVRVERWAENAASQ